MMVQLGQIAASQHLAFHTPPDSESCQVAFEISTEK